MARPLHFRLDFRQGRRHPQGRSPGHSVRSRCGSGLCVGGAIAALLSSCSGAQLVSVPFDPGGRSLNSPAGENSPKISGNFIVFSSDRRGGQEVYLYDLRAGSILELPGLNALDMTESSPAVSENGQFIVFVGSRQGRTGIYVYNRATRQQRNLTENLPAEVRRPTISADGRLIAFEANLQGQWDIRFITRDGLPVPNLPR
jgi:Tol biopolymer transport system component